MGRTVRVRGRQVDVMALRPETFGDEPMGVALPPGTRGLTKVTNRTASGPGTYVGVAVPPTSESASRRLALPASNRAEEVRFYQAVDWLFGSIGVVAGSTTNDLQIEVQNPEVLKEVGRRRLPYDLDARFRNATIVAGIGGLVGLAIGIRYGRPLLGLLAGIVIGFFAGLLFPTDWGELSSLWFGATDINLMFMLG